VGQKLEESCVRIESSAHQGCNAVRSIKLAGSVKRTKEMKKKESKEKERKTMPAGITLQACVK